MRNRRDLEAARWAERRSDGVPPEEFPRFAGWRDRPANADAFHRAVDTRRYVAALADHPELANLRAEARARVLESAGGSRTAWWPAVAAAAIAVLAVPAAVRFGSDAPTPRASAVPAPAPAIYATGVGERRPVVLADGSRVTLDTASRVRVAFSGRERRVDLDFGQAMFQVAKDASRPFVVAAGGREVTARGTTFDVRLDADRLRVALVEGRVDVASRDARTLAMRPDDLLVARGGRTTVRRDPEAVAALTGWREGLLVFQDRSLAEAVAEMNRYAARPVMLGDAAVGRIRVSGSFRSDQIGAFVNALRIGFPVDARPRADGTVVLVKRP